MKFVVTYLLLLAYVALGMRMTLFELKRLCGWGVYIVAVALWPLVTIHTLYRIHKREGLRNFVARHRTHDEENENE